MKMSLSKNSAEVELKDILNEMNIPEERKELNQHNLLWLSRNIGIYNASHDKYYRARNLLIFLLKNEN